MNSRDSSNVSFNVSQDRIVEMKGASSYTNSYENFTRHNRIPFSWCGSRWSRWPNERTRLSHELRKNEFSHWISLESHLELHREKMFANQVYTLSADNGKKKYHFRQSRGYHPSSKLLLLTATRHHLVPRTINTSVRLYDILLYALYLAIIMYTRRTRGKDPTRVNLRTTIAIILKYHN
jgi:hypothetical protein